MVNRYQVAATDSRQHDKMIDTLLVNYGVLGLWTIYLIRKEQTLTRDLKITVQNNTLAINKVSRVIELCKKKK